MDTRKWITNGVESVPRTRPAYPFVVLDQNCMRDDRGVDHVTPLLEAARAGGPGALVPDVALVEMSQHPDAWERTMRDSFRLLGAEPEAAFLGRAVAEMAREELVTGVPMSDIVDWERVESLRDIIRELRGEPGHALAHLRTHLPAARESAARDFYSHEDNHQLASEQNKGWRKVLSPTGSKALRKDDEQLLRLLALNAVKEFGAAALMRCGASADLAVRLLSQPSMCLAVVAAPMVSSLLWVEDGGLDGRLPKDASNDSIDLDYVRLSVFAAGIRSLDNRVVRMAGHLGAVMDMQVLDARQGEHGIRLPAGQDERLSSSQGHGGSDQ